MRLTNRQITADHDYLQDVSEDDHHNSAVTVTLQVNGLSIAPGTYNYDVAIGKSGCKSAQGILRSYLSMALQGHTGLWFVCGASADTSSSVGVRPYAGGPVGSYAGGYSRMHGDTYLSHYDFGYSIRLNDVYINGSNLRFVFYNVSGINRNLVVYGTAICK